MASATRTMDDVLAEIDALKQEVVAMSDNGASQTSAWLERGRNTAEAVKRAVASGLKTGKEKTTAAIQQYPLSSVLIALGIGVVAGALVMRRRN